MFHTQSNSFSMCFSMANGHRAFDEGEMSSFATSPSANSVDCTLSLGTPSTRLANGNSHRQEKACSSCMSDLGWNKLPSSKNTAQWPLSASKSHRGGSNVNSSSGGGDPLLSRRCANCDTTSTPLWRNGPRGPKSLCNACGIRFKKEERRAAAAAATSNGAAATHRGYVDSHRMMNSSWIQQQETAPRYPGVESLFVKDDVIHSDTVSGGGIPFLSWRFEVTDRPSYVQDDFSR